MWWGVVSKLANGNVTVYVTLNDLSSINVIYIIYEYVKYFY